MNRKRLAVLVLVLFVGGLESSASLSNLRGYKCLAQYRAERMVKTCSTMQFGSIQIPVCDVVAEYKDGWYTGHGATCGACFAAGRSSLISEDWVLSSEWGKQCRAV